MSVNLNKYINNGFEILKKIKIDDCKISEKIVIIQSIYDKYNKNKSKFTEKYRNMMENQFNQWDILNEISVINGGKKRSIVGNDNFCEELIGINSSLEKYIFKLNALKYLSFLSEENRNVVMIGANGSGKTTLLRHLMENTDNSDIGYYQADRLMVLDSTYNPERENVSFNKNMNDNNMHAANINETNPGYYIGKQFAQTIALLEKKRFSELEKSHKGELCKDSLITDYILKTWNELIQDRELSFGDGLQVSTKDGIFYPIKYLSSGEKSVLYFLVRILLLDEKKYYFIDEPENNLNPSIISRLWNAIEKRKKDSIFVYLTHNSEFVSTRLNAKIYWIKKYNGNNIWEYEELKENDDLPQELMISLMGNKKPVVFCESENENMYDTLLFKVIFPDYKIVSAGGCDKVISKVKAYKNLGLPQSAYGIIDCDYKSDSYLNGYKEKSIYHLPFFEIENFFVCSTILKPFLNKYSMDSNSFNNIMCKVSKIFGDEQEIFIVRNVANELHSSSYKDGINKLKNVEELRNSFQEYQKKINIDDLIEKYKEKAQEIINRNEYDYFLRYLDHKNIITDLIPLMKLEEDVVFERDILKFINEDESLIISIRNKYFPDIKYSSGI